MLIYACDMSVIHVSEHAYFRKFIFWTKCELIKNYKILITLVFMVMYFCINIVSIVCKVGIVVQYSHFTYNTQYPNYLPTIPTLSTLPTIPTMHVLTIPTLPTILTYPHYLQYSIPTLPSILTIPTIFTILTLHRPTLHYIIMMYSRSLLHTETTVEL